MKFCIYDDILYTILITNKLLLQFKLSQLDQLLSVVNETLQLVQDTMEI